MTNWVLVAWAKTLIDAFNMMFPGRPKASDGTVGDAAHQKEKSGHNPDDTPGVQAERTDADTIPEVRAVDITAFTQLWDVIQAILASEVRECLIYIIYRGVIWRKATGWKPERYTGSDQHYTHAHFSGDPDYDTTAVNWLPVFTPKGNAMTIDMTQPVPGIAGLTVGQWMVDLWEWAATNRGLTPADAAGIPLPRTDDRFQSPTFPGEVIAQLKRIASPAPVDIDPEALAATLAPEVARLLSPSIATAVIEEMRTRLES